MNHDMDSRVACIIMLIGGAASATCYHIQRTGCGEGSSFLC